MLKSSEQNRDYHHLRQNIAELVRNIFHNLLQVSSSVCYDNLVARPGFARTYFFPKIFFHLNLALTMTNTIKKELSILAQSF